MEPLLGRNIDRYVVEKLLGRGAMAAVYRVRHRTLNTLHALKVLTLAGDRVRERLVQEGQVQAQLRHPNVLSVTDVLDVDGAPGLLMEFIDGPTLEGYIEAQALPLDQAESLFRGVLLGVAEAHGVGLVHRDLKPANVLVAYTSRGPVPKVADFGLAKVLADEEGGGGLHRTRSGSTMGTPAYMAPEQIRDAKHVDHRADIFSLGAILYELVARRRPFEGEDILAVFNAVASGQYRPLEGAPDRVNLAVSGALTVRRDARIPDCETLLDVLDGKRTTWADVSPRRRTHSFGGGAYPQDSAASGESTAGSTPQVLSIGSALAGAPGGGSATLDPSSFSGEGGGVPANSLATIDPVPDLSARPHVPQAMPTVAATLGPSGSWDASSGQLATRPSELSHGTLDAHGHFGASQVANGPPTLSVPIGTEVHVVGKTIAKPGRGATWIMVLRSGGVVSIAVVAALALFFVFPRGPASPAPEPTQPAALAEVVHAAAPDEPAPAGKAAAPPLVAAAPAAPALAEPAPEVKAVAASSASKPGKELVAKSTGSEAAPASSSGTAGATRTAPVAAKPAAPEASAGSAAAMGELRVSSVPSASLSIDGAAKGRSGTRHALPAGKHQVTLATDDGKTLTRSVTVSSGKSELFCWDFEINAECD